MLFYVYERYGLETGRWCLGPYGRLRCGLEPRPSAPDSAALNTASAAQLRLQQLLQPVPTLRAAKHQQLFVWGLWVGVTRASPNPRFPSHPKFAFAVPHQYAALAPPPLLPSTCLHASVPFPWRPHRGRWLWSCCCRVSLHSPRNHAPGCRDTLQEPLLGASSTRSARPARPQGHSSHR